MKLAPKTMLMAGILLSVGAPCLGIIFTVIGMVGAFHTLGQNGISDPAILAGSIGKALVATWAGVLIGILGLPIILAAVVLHFIAKRRPSQANP